MSYELKTLFTAGDFNAVTGIVDPDATYLRPAQIRALEEDLQGYVGSRLFYKYKAEGTFGDEMKDLDVATAFFVIYKTAEYFVNLSTTKDSNAGTIETSLTEANAKAERAKTRAKDYEGRALSYAKKMLTEILDNAEALSLTAKEAAKISEALRGIAGGGLFLGGIRGRILK